VSAATDDCFAQPGASELTIELATQKWSVGANCGRVLATDPIVSLSRLQTTPMATLTATPTRAGGLTFLLGGKRKCGGDCPWGGDYAEATPGGTETNARMDLGRCLKCAEVRGRSDREERNVAKVRVPTLAPGRVRGHKRRRSGGRRQGAGRWASAVVGLWDGGRFGPGLRVRSNRGMPWAALIGW
jgi:hypothetical protein